MMYSSSRNWKVKQLWEDFSGIRIEWEHTGNTTDFHFWYGSNPLYDIFGWMNINKRKLLPRFSDTLEPFGARDYPSTILEVEPTRIQTCLEHIHCGDRELRYSSQWPLGCVPKFSTHLHIGSIIYIYIDHHMVLVYLFFAFNHPLFDIFWPIWEWLKSMERHFIPYQFSAVQQGTCSRSMNFPTDSSL